MQGEEEASISFLPGQKSFYSVVLHSFLSFGKILLVVGMLHACCHMGTSS